MTGLPRSRIIHVQDVKIMLDEKDLQAIAGMLAQQKEEILEETTHRMNILLETKVQTQFNLLAEGQKTILETLAPKNRVEELENEVAFLKSVMKLHSEQISELKKAQ